MDIFSKDLSFGTAGLRAAMSFGFNRMNAITVQLASQGIAEYLCLLSPTLQTGRASPVPAQRIVVIGHDHRRLSRTFAEIVAKTMRARRLAVLLLPSIVPTPLVPFAINLLGERAAFGVMITASHNPADDNGYKVYGANGCQVRPARAAPGRLKERSDPSRHANGAVSPRIDQLADRQGDQHAH